MNENDNIESAFQDRFDNDSISNEGWNEPRDQVWDKIDADLSQKQRRLFGLPFFILLAGLLISLFGNGYILNKNNDLARQINEIRIDLEQCSSQVNDIKYSKNIPIEINKNSNTVNQDISSLGLENSIQKDLKKEIKNERNPTLKVKYTQNIENSLNSLKDKDYLNSPKHSKTLGDEDRNNSIQLNKDTKLISDNMKVVASSKNINSEEREEIKLLSVIKTNNIKLLEARRELSHLNGPKVAPIITNNRIQSLISIKGGIVGSSLIKNGRQESALSEAIDKEYAQLGSILEIKYTSKISDRWSMSGGLGLVNQKFITEYDLTLPYNVGEEIIENGIGHIDFEHSLPTSFGNTDTELRLRRPEIDQSIEIESVNIDFNTEHNFLSLTVPLSIDYTSIDLASGFFIGVDAVPSYIISASSGISSVVSQHNKIESVNNRSTSDYEELKKLNLSIGAHLGYRYPLSPKSGLEFSANYLRNLNSYFSSANFSSRSQGIQLSAGYFFFF